MLGGSAGAVASLLASGAMAPCSAERAIGSCSALGEASGFVGGVCRESSFGFLSSLARNFRKREESHRGLFEGGEASAFSGFILKSK